MTEQINELAVRLAKEAGADMYGHPDYQNIIVNGKVADEFCIAIVRLAVKEGMERAADIVASTEETQFDCADTIRAEAEKL